MNYLDAAQAILQQAGQSLRYEQIAERALTQGILSPQGLTPEATVASRLYTDTLQEGSRFIRAGKGVFSLADGVLAASTRRFAGSTKLRETVCASCF